MKANTSKELPKDINIRCYACEKMPATHVCRYELDELMVQVCLCVECMKLDTHNLIKHTIGLDEERAVPA